LENDNTLKELEQILKHRKKYIVKKDATRRNLDAVNGTLKELAEFVATMAEDMNKMTFGDTK